MSKSKQVFILGAPRSGTTFLASLLSETRYKAPFETQFIPKYYHKLESYGDIKEFSNFSTLLKEILSERAVMQWKLDLDLNDFFKSFGENITYARMVDRLCAMKHKNNNDGYWGEKTPWYLNELDNIYQLFPDAKYIYIVRDGRDVALSLLEKEWGPNNIYACATYWKSLNGPNPVLDKLRKSGQLLELRYEDLLDDTERYIQEFYEFLGEPYNNEMVEKLASTTQKGNYYKWKNKFSASEIKLFDHIAASTLNKFGYETFESENKLSPVLEQYYKIHNKLIWAKFMFKTNVIDGFKIKFLGKEPFAD